MKNLMNKSKFLPKFVEIFEFCSTLSIDQIQGNIPRKKNFLKIPDWQGGKGFDESHWFKLSALNKYIVLPVISLKMTHAESGSYRYEGVIKYGDLSKKILQFWLFLSLAVYSIFPLYIVGEYAFGDGLIAYSHNGVPQPDVYIFPWVFLFLLVHFVGFVLFPAIVINLGWQKTIELKNEILKQAK